MTKKVGSKKTNKKNCTNQKGITLIALIITIIIMLILVAVTVTIAINGGLFGMAKTASEETTHEEVKEMISSELTEYEIKNVLGQTSATSVQYLAEKGYFKEEYTPETESYTIKSDKISNVSLGKGTDKTTGDVYVVEKANIEVASILKVAEESTNDNDWELKYYKTSNDANPKILLSFAISGIGGNEEGNPSKQVAQNVSELVAGDYVDYVYTDASGEKQTIHCIVLYDKSDEALADVDDGIQVVTVGSLGNKVLQNNEYYVKTVDSYDNSSICQKFTSGKMTRVVGSDPRTGYEVDFSEMLNDWSEFENYKDLDDWVDYKRLEQSNILVIESAYWYNVCLTCGGEWTGCGLLEVAKDGSLNVNVLEDYSVTWEINPDYVGGESGLRLVFKLKDNLPIIGGTGEEGTPYQLVEVE